MDTQSATSDTRLQNITWRLICASLLLGMLYVGKDLVLPVVVAAFASFCLIPLVRTLQRLHLPKTPAVVLVVAVTCTLGTLSLIQAGAQLGRIAAGLPHYEYNIRDKLQQVDDLTLGRFATLSNKTRQVFAQFSGKAASLPGSQDASRVMTVQVDQPGQSMRDLVTRIMGGTLHFLELSALALVVLIFLLIDYEMFRDRLIHLLGGRNVRHTTAAVNEVGARLTRYFISQITINLACGGIVAAGLSILGVPEAFFWGGLTAIARFIPYIGTWMAMLSTVLVAAAVSPGWSLALATCVFFVVVELVVSQFVEPLLYGHSTGLSPISVLIGALFWSALWGPIGLVLSTPLTLCLVVAGRYIPSLHFLEVTLGDIPGLTMAEKFYQRALSGDDRELKQDLQRFLQSRSLGEYCDRVLVPFMELAEGDFKQHAITAPELSNLTRAVSGVLDSLAQTPRHTGRQLGVNLARRLRRVAAPATENTAEAAPRRVSLYSDGSTYGDLNAQLLGTVLRREGYLSDISRFEPQRLVEQMERDGDALHACLISGPDGEPADSFRRTLAECGRSHRGNRALVFSPTSQAGQRDGNGSDNDDVVTSYRALVDRYRR